MHEVPLEVLQQEVPKAALRDTVPEVRAVDGDYLLAAHVMNNGEGNASSQPSF